VEAAKYPKLIDGILIVEDDRLLRGRKAPDQVHPEIAEDIVDARTGLYITIASQAPETIVWKVLKVQLFVAVGQIAPYRLDIPKLTQRGLP